MSALRRLSWLSVLLLLLAPLLGISCGAPRVISVSREQLFTLGYGPGEDQLDLFQVEGAAGPLKTRLSMREGIFSIANGNGAKVVRFSSFGDVLSMVYDPARNPEPLLLKPADGIGAPGRRAVQYPFRAVGELAVDSRQVLHVEDRLPDDRRVFDAESNALLDYVVLRFDGEGKFLDYLGQEGLGGTPFPYIVSIHATKDDDCVVISMTQSAWLVHWFDPRGMLRYSLKIARSALPGPPGATGLIASLDRMVPDSGGKDLLLKIDYYRESVDKQTESFSGIAYAGSWVYRMNPADASYGDSWQIPPEENASARAGDGQDKLRIPEFLGVAGDRLFFISADDEGKTRLSVFDRSSKAVSRFTIDIAQDELYYTSLYLSPEGILCALLGTRFEARVVWWRFDKILGSIGGGADR